MNNHFNLLGLAILAVLLFSSPQAYSQSLLNAKGQIDLKLSQNYTEEVRKFCPQKFKGQKVFFCQNVCRTLHNRTNDLYDTLNRPNVPQRSLNSSAQHYIKSVKTCGAIWPNRQAPMALKPFVILAQNLQKGRFPKPVTAQEKAARDLNDHPRIFTKKTRKSYQKPKGNPRQRAVKPPRKEVKNTPDIYDILTRKRIYGRRLLERMAPEPLMLINELESVRSTCAKGDQKCHLACANGISMTNYLHHHVKSQYLTDLTGIEENTLNFITQCMKNTAPQNSPKIDIYVNDLKSHRFSQHLDVLLGNKKTTKISAPAHMTVFSGEEFFKDYPADTDARFTDKAFRYKTYLKSNYADVVTAITTLGNYCPVTDKSCVRRVIHINQIAAWNELNQLFSPTFAEEIKREANQRFLNGSLSLSDYKNNYKMMPTTYSILMKNPKKYWPKSLLTLETFGKELIALEPSRAFQTSVRLYCTDENYRKNPFRGLGGCEYLSALYYGDFQMVAQYDLLYSESTLRAYEKMVYAQDDFWSKRYRIQQAKNQTNPRTGSLIDFILVNYMMEYNVKYAACFEPAAKTYKYTYEKTTEMKNRYGMRITSWTSTRSESFKVNPNLIPIYENSPFRMSHNGIGFQNMLQAFHNKTAATKSTEQKYGIKNLGSTMILNSLNRMMSKNSCDSPLAKKLEERLIGYKNMREKYNTYIKKFPYNSLLGRF